MAQMIICDVRKVFRGVQKRKLHKRKLCWFDVHVKVSITNLYYNWSKNHIGTKLRKQSRWQAWKLAEF